MTTDEDTPMEPVQRRLLDAARAIAKLPPKEASPPDTAYHFVPARLVWDLQDVLADYDFEMGKTKKATTTAAPNAQSQEP